MKYLVSFLLISFVCTYNHAQEYDSYSINKKVLDYPSDNDFSTPLKAFTSIQYLLVNGQLSELYKKSMFKIRLTDPNGWADEVISKEEQTALLNHEIKEVITYCNSVATVISLANDSIYHFRNLNFEQGIWVNGGEDVSMDLEINRNKTLHFLPLRLKMLERTNEILNTPTDTAMFVKYLEENGENPKLFLLDALAKHRLVIYGERHRRELSCQLLKDLVNDPDFRKTTGTVFMELQTYKQNEIDRFFNNCEYIDSTILIDIYRDMQLPGWYDKGGFEFLLTLWELNRKLPEQEKIKVVFTDFQPPFKNIKTKDDVLNFEKNALKRNSHMADVIEQTIKNSSDSRNNLFIVGYGHAYKSSAINLNDESPEGDCSAANQLTSRFSAADIFSVRVHTSGINGYIRGGMFDSVFRKNNSRPIAFCLKNSPFGREIIEEWAWEKDNFGNFGNNYDGYIYLGGEPIDLQPEYRLIDIYTEEFVEEIRRRAHLFGVEDKIWFGVPNKSLSLENIMIDLKVE